jgi:hypothetical protein
VALFFGTFKIYASHATVFRSAAAAKKEMIRTDVMKSLEDKECLLPDDHGSVEDDATCKSPMGKETSLLCEEDLAPKMFIDATHEAPPESDDEDVVVIHSPRTKKVSATEFDVYDLNDTYALQARCEGS